MQAAAPASAAMTPTDTPAAVPSGIFAPSLPRAPDALPGVTLGVAPSDRVAVRDAVGLRVDVPEDVTLADPPPPPPVLVGDCDDAVDEAFAATVRVAVGLAVGVIV